MFADADHAIRGQASPQRRAQAAPGTRSVLRVDDRRTPTPQSHARQHAKPVIGRAVHMHQVKALDLQQRAHAPDPGPGREQSALELHRHDTHARHARGFQKQAAAGRRGNHDVVRGPQRPHQRQYVGGMAAAVGLVEIGIENAHEVALNERGLPPRGGSGRKRVPFQRRPMALGKHALVQGAAGRQVVDPQAARAEQPAGVAKGRPDV